MIVKYLTSNVWAYIDHARQVASKEYDGAELITEYNNEVKTGQREDIASKDVTTSDIAESNKIFLKVSEYAKDMTDELNAHVVNLVNICHDISINVPVYAILLYLEDTKEYDAMVLVTNQKCYLMNDEGKTIERLS